MRRDPVFRFDPDRAATMLSAEFATGPAEDALHGVLRLYAGEVAVVSSFGAEAAVLLHMVAGINPHVPVLLSETGMLFTETLQYQQDLARDLGLSDVRLIRPDPRELDDQDRFRALHATDPDRCCHLRKVAPLARALRPFQAVVTGRKRYQASTRKDIARFETDGGRLKANPLASWSAAELHAYARAHALRPHPLVPQGYASIGCRPCTTPVQPGEDTRAGRWRGSTKTECGIHRAAPDPTARERRAT